MHVCILCMHACTYVCMHVRMFVMYVMHACMHVCMHVCMHPCMLCILWLLCMHAYIAYARVQTHARTQAYACKHTYNHRLKALGARNPKIPRRAPENPHAMYACMPCMYTVSRSPRLFPKNHPKQHNRGREAPPSPAGGGACVVLDGSLGVILGFRALYTYMACIHSMHAYIAYIHIHNMLTCILCMHNMHNMHACYTCIICMHA